MSLTPWFIAAGDLFALFVYIAIFLFWMVAKKIQGAGRRAPPPDAPPETSGRGDGPQLDPTFQEFLETLTGQKLEKQEPAVPPPVQPPPVTPEFVTPARVEPVVQATPVPARVELRPGVLEPSEYERLDLSGEDALPPADTLVAPHVKTPVLGAASSLAGIQTPKIPLPSLKLPSQRLDTDHRLRVFISTPDTLRRAMVERIVLGKPLAMGTDPEESQMGW